MDGIFECMVQRRIPAYAPIVKALLIAGGVLGFIGTMVSPLAIVLTIACGVAGFFIIPRFSVEWEYTFLDGSLRIDCIYDRSKRKEKEDLSFDRVELVALAKSPDITRITENDRSGYTIIDYSSQEPDHQKYGMIYNDGARRLLLLIEPDERMLNAMRRYSPRKVQTY